MSASNDDDALPATEPQPPPSYVVTVHAADEATLWTARSCLGSTRELSAGGGASAAVEFFDDRKTSSSLSSSSTSSTFDPLLYFSALRTRSLGRCLLLSPLLPSTQDLVQKASSGVEAATRGGGGRALPEGTVCVADAQASGRGRGGNAWTSPPGCLMFSLSADLEGLPGTSLPFVQYLVSLALVRAARREVLGGNGGSGGKEEEEGGGATTMATTAAAAAAAAESIRIKWPNDLYAGGKKLAGVLCHSSYVSKSESTSKSTSNATAPSAGGGNGNGNNGNSSNTCFRLTAGVGINVTNEPLEGAASLAGLLLPPGGSSKTFPPSSSSSSPSLPFSRETLLASTLTELEPLLDELTSPLGFSEGLRRAYEGAWLHSGQVVEVEEGAAEVAASGASIPSSSSSPSPCRVTITGLSASGFLAAVDVRDGVTRYELHPDGNSLDFFRGLVRKKAGPPPL